MEIKYKMNEVYNSYYAFNSNDKNEDYLKCNILVS